MVGLLLIGYLLLRVWCLALGCTNDTTSKLCCIDCILSMERVNILGDFSLIDLIFLAAEHAYPSECLNAECQRILVLGRALDLFCGLGVHFDDEL